MATETDTTHHPEDSEDVEARTAHAGHPGVSQYWKIFWILVVVTAVEVVLYYWSIPGVNLNNAVLGVLALAKFVVVVGYFMHLKFDNRILRRLFVTGLILAVLVYVVYLLTMGVFIQPPDQRQ